VARACVGGSSSAFPAAGADFLVGRRLEVGDIVVTVLCLMDGADRSGRSPVAGAIRSIGAESDGSVAISFL
jgi:hypothetical protein